MAAGAAQGIASRAALRAIRLYQRRISPYKGFRCAFAAAHGGSGCSGFARERIAKVGLWPAIADIRARLVACKAAAVALSGSGDENGTLAREGGDGDGKQGGPCNTANGACASLGGCADCSGGPIACSCW